MAKIETIKVNLRVPIDIYDTIKESCVRTKRVYGKDRKKVISLNDAFVDFLWRGIGTIEDSEGDDEKDPI